MPGGIQLGAQVENEIRIGRRRKLRRGVIRLEGGQHLFGVVREIQHVGRVLAGIGAVQARQGLHGLDAPQSFVHIHATQQRLIEAGLEFVRHQQDLIFVALESFADVAAFQIGVQCRAVLGETIRAGFLVVHLAGEGDHRTDLVAVFLDVFVDSQLPAHRLQTTADHHHRLGLPIEQRSHILAEVFHHDFYFLRDVVGVELDPAHDALERRAALDFLVVDFLAFVRQLENQLVGCVVLQHVEDEFLFDGLAHGIDVERVGHIVRCRFACRVGARAEYLQGLVLRCSGERDKGDAAIVGARRHLRRQNVFSADFAAVVQLCEFLGRQQRLELGRRLAGL